MSRISFTIPGEPTGKARPRITSHGTYTPKKTKDYERKVVCAYLAAGEPLPNELGRVWVDIAAYFSIPKSASKAQKEHMRKMEIEPLKKPDADNIAKAVCDALNGIAYKDDAQITRLAVSKHYAEIPRVDVVITRWEEGL